MPVKHALVLVIFLDGGNGFVDQILDRVGMVLDALLADAQDVALDFIQQGVHFAFVLKDPADNRGAGLDHLPQEVLLPHDVQVIAQAGGGGDRVGQGGEVGQAADLLEQLLVLEPLLEGDQVNRLPLVIHF